jgi:hypothetical protein
VRPDEHASATVGLPGSGPAAVGSLTPSKTPPADSRTTLSPSCCTTSARGASERPSESSSRTTDSRGRPRSVRRPRRSPRKCQAVPRARCAVALQRERESASSVSGVSGPQVLMSCRLAGHSLFARRSFAPEGPSISSRLPMLYVYAARCSSLKSLHVPCAGDCGRTCSTVRVSRGLSAARGPTWWFRARPGSLAPGCASWPGPKGIARTSPRPDALSAVRRRSSGARPVTTGTSRDAQHPRRPAL